jgi:hypothetical protein
MLLTHIWASFKSLHELNTFSLAELTYVRLGGDLSLPVFDLRPGTGGLGFVAEQL